MLAVLAEHLAKSLGFGTSCTHIGWRKKTGEQLSVKQKL